MATCSYRHAGFAAAMIFVVVGCGGANKPVPVRGKVTLDGTPVGGASIQFVPEGGGGMGRPASAEAGPDGTYKLTTQDPGDGALPGNYLVLISWEPEPPPQFRSTEAGPSRQEQQKAIDDYVARQKKAGKGPVVPAIYADPSKTPLKAKVPAPNGTADFALSSKP